jgi:hypothetical protein
MARDKRDKKVRLSRLLLPPLVLGDMLSEGADEAAKAGRGLGITQGDIGVVMLLAIGALVGTTALGSHGLGGVLSTLLWWATAAAAVSYISRRYLVALWTTLRSQRGAVPFIVVLEERDGQAGWGVVDQRKHETFAWRTVRGEALDLARHLNRALAARDETSDAWWGA